jgi:predicted DNA-binding transcriptional regulator YafY
VYKQLTQLLTAARLISRAQGATIKELEDRVGISRRSVYRLLDALEDLGYTFYDEYDGKERTVKLNEERDRLRWWVPLPKVKLSFEDCVLLDYLFREVTETPILAERVAQLRRKIAGLIADGGYSVSDSDPLRGTSFKKKPTLLHTAPVGKALTPQMAELVQALFQGIEEQTVCIVSYEALSTGTVKTYRIHPLALFDHDGGLYVFVLVPYYGDIRMLSVERIRTLDLTEESFEPPESFDPEKRLSDPFGIILDEPFIARIWFSAEQAPYIRERDWTVGSSFEDAADGSTVFTVETAGVYELKRWVLSFGADAELLEPTSLREEIAEALSLASANYRVTS